MQSIGSIETYAFGMNKDLICKKKTCKQYNKAMQKMINRRNDTKENMKEHNSNLL